MGATGPIFAPHLTDATGVARPAEMPSQGEEAALGFPDSLLPQRRLGRRQPRDRDSERRARHVVELDLMAERDRGWVAAVLAADANLEVLADAAAAFDAN